MALLGETSCLGCKRSRIHQKSLPDGIFGRPTAATSRQDGSNASGTPECRSGFAGRTSVSSGASLPHSRLSEKECAERASSSAKTDEDHESHLEFPVGRPPSSIRLERSRVGDAVSSAPDDVQHVNAGLETAGLRLHIQVVNIVRSQSPKSASTNGFLGALGTLFPSRA